MNNFKKAGILTGAVIGGVIGGTISLAGKLTHKKFIDELGSNIVDSTILTGEIAGEAVSGTTKLISGKASHQERKAMRGKHELKSAGGKVVNNVVTNVKTVVDQSSEIAEGVRARDTKKIKNGAKTLAKVVAIGLITVGAIKTEGDTETDSEKTNNTERKSKKDQDADPDLK